MKQELKEKIEQYALLENKFLDNEVKLTSTIKELQAKVE